MGMSNGGIFNGKHPLLLNNKSFIKIYASIHIHRKRKVRFGGETEACID